ncbi:MAG: hypothetical protein OXC48_10630 [Endozoicomonadaceae bacterium]|nr:hypothetical protein [Endozoicomonadaceae bacterium]
MLYLYRLFYLIVMFAVLCSAISNAAPLDQVSKYQIKKASEDVAKIAPDFTKNFIFCPQGLNAIEVLSSALPKPVYPVNKTPDALQDAFDRYVFGDDDEVLKSADFVFSKYFLTEDQKMLLTKKGHPHLFDDKNSYPQDVLKANEIISELTNAALKKVIPEEQDDFAFIATNVVYFKAKWGVYCEKADPFMWKKDPQSSTKVTGFEIDTDDNKGVKAGNTHGYNVYSIPINKTDGEYKFIIAIPEKSFGKKPEQAILDEEIAISCIEVARSAKQLSDITLIIPDFHIEQTHKLNDLFKSSSPFKASQKAFIKVNQEGVEASACTSMILLECARYAEEVKIDEPFAFWVINDTNGKILFTGTVYDPQHK